MSDSIDLDLDDIRARTEPVAKSVLVTPEATYPLGHSLTAHRLAKDVLALLARIDTLTADNEQLRDGWTEDYGEAYRAAETRIATLTAENKQLRMMLDEVALDRARIAGDLAGTEARLDTLTAERDQLWEAVHVKNRDIDAAMLDTKEAEARVAVLTKALERIRDYDPFTMEQEWPSIVDFLQEAAREALADGAPNELQGAPKLEVADGAEQ